MKSTAKTVGLVMVIMIFSRLMAFISTTIYVPFYGNTEEMNIYSYAVAFPNIIFNSFGTAIATVVIPIFAAHISIGQKDKAFRFADNAISISIVFAALLTVLGIMLAPVFPLLTKFRGESYDFAVTALRIIFPVMIFYALNYVLQGILQSLGRYNMPAFVSVPSSLVLIFYVLIMGNRFGVKGLLIATLFGLSLQGLILIPPVYATEYRYRPRLDFKSEDIRKAMRLIPPVLIGTSAYQLNMLFNITVTANFEKVVTIMVFVQNLILYSILAFIYSVTAVAFPRFTMLVAQNDLEGFKSSLIKTIRSVMYFLLPATAGFIAIRHQMMDFIVGWGKLTRGDIDLASAILALYALGIAGIGVKEIVDRAFYSLKDTKKPAVNSIVVVTVNVGASLILIRFMGPLGIPVAYSLSSLTGGAVLLYMLRKKIGPFGLKGLGSNTFKVLISSVIMFMAVYAVTVFLSGYSFGGSFLDNGIKLFVQVAVGGLVYLVSTVVLRVEEAVETLDKLRVRLNL